MKVLLSWLRDFAPIDAPVERIGHDLSMLGMAVEEEVHLGQGLDGIVVARVAVEQDGDRHVCRMVAGPTSARRAPWGSLGRGDRRGAAQHDRVAHAGAQADRHAEHPAELVGRHAQHARG